MRIVSVFGNPDLEPDALPLSLIPMLSARFPNITFEHVDPNEECVPPENPWYIIDAVKGIDTVTLITEDDLLVIKKRLTMHDYDLGMHLVLLKKIHSELKLRIIGVPFEVKVKEAAGQVIEMLKEILPNPEE